MNTLSTILKGIGEFKNGILVIVSLAGFIWTAGDFTVNYIADEVVERTGEQNIRIYRMNRAHDSIRFEMAADLAAKVLTKQDSISFILSSINQWQQHVDRRIGQMAKKISEDTLPSPHQRELFEIRKLLREKEASEQARIDTQEAMRAFIKKSLEQIESIKKGDRAQ